MPKKYISFQGLHGAYSDLVCRKFYKDYLTFPCDSFEEAISAVENKKAELALIPVENNIAGRVADMHFLLEKIKSIQERNALNLAQSHMASSIGEKLANQQITNERVRNRQSAEIRNLEEN